MLSLAREECCASQGEKKRVPDQRELYLKSVRMIAANAPLRILPGEKIAGAATLKVARLHMVPISGYASVSHTTWI